MFFYQINHELSLRLLAKQDAEDLFKLIDKSRPILRKWLPWLDSTLSVEDSQQFIEHSLLLFNNQQALTAGIFFNQQLVGVVSYNELDWKNRIGYIGYWLDHRFQGKGIMSQSVSALVDYGFTQLNLNRIDIRAATDNVKSRAIPKRLGFSYEGRIRDAEWLYDRYVDHAVYSMLAAEWFAK